MCSVQYLLSAGLPNKPSINPAFLECTVLKKIITLNHFIKTFSVMFKKEHTQKKYSNLKSLENILNMFN